jgi:hypothetical protein
MKIQSKMIPLILISSILFGINEILKAQYDTSPSYSVDGSWVMKNNKKFFAKIAGYFYIERLPEYKNLLNDTGNGYAFKYINSSFNVLMLPSWPLFSVEDGYQRLAYENCYHPAFNIEDQNTYYRNVTSSDKTVLMTQTTYMMDILRYAGLNDYRRRTGYFNRDNIEKKDDNRWVLGPRDMGRLTRNSYFSTYFGSIQSWGHFQLNIANGLMRNRGQFFWFLTDEPERNGNDWFLPADALRKITNSLINNDLGNICLLSLGPVKYGNKYLFSKEKPELIPPNNLSAYSNDYFYSYGSDYAGLKKNFITTLRYYKGIGNVLGINDYSLINENPAYAGYFVDWIREEKGEVPVWIWVPPYLKYTDYALLKCQVFSAIVHGATGIGFWLMHREGTSDPEQLSKTLRISQELELVESLLVADEAIEIMGNQKWLKGEKDVHYTIRKLDSGNIVIIAVNTSKVNSEMFELSLNNPYYIDIQKKFAPMEVEIFF